MRLPPTALLALSLAGCQAAEGPAQALPELERFVRQAETNCLVPTGTIEISDASRRLSMPATTAEHMRYGDFMCLMNELRQDAPPMRGVRVDVELAGPAGASKDTP